MKHIPTNRGKQQSNDRGVLIATVVIAGAATLSLVIALIQAFIFDKQLEEMKAASTLMQTQLEEMRAEQRAWVYAKAKIAGPIVFSDDGASTRISFSTENTGKLPGTGVNVFAHLNAVEIAGPVSSGESPEACQGGKNLDVPIGSTVFPGSADNGTLVFEVSTFGPGFAKHKIPVGKPVALVISGCVRYQSGAKPPDYCTGIDFAITRSDSTSSFGFDPAIPIYDQVGLSISPRHFGQNLSECPRIQ